MTEEQVQLILRMASALEQVVLGLLSVEERLTALEETLEAIYDPSQRSA